MAYGYDPSFDDYWNQYARQNMAPVGLSDPGVQVALDEVPDEAGGGNVPRGTPPAPTPSMNAAPMPAPSPRQPQTLAEAAPLLGEIRQMYQAHAPQQPQIRPFKGMHERYQPEIDSLLNQYHGLAYDPLAMQPHEPVKNLMRGLAQGLEGYATAREFRDRGATPLLSIAAGTAWSKAGRLAEDDVIDRIKAMSGILTQIAQMEHSNESAYSENAQGANQIGDFYNEQFQQPVKAESTLQQGRQNEAMAGTAQARTQDIGATQPSRINANQGRANASNAAAGLSGARKATVEATRPKQVEGLDLRNIGQKWKNINEKAKADHAEGTVVAKQKKAEADARLAAIKAEHGGSVESGAYKTQWKLADAYGRRAENLEVSIRQTNTAIQKERGLTKPNEEYINQLTNTLSNQRREQRQALDDRLSTLKNIPLKGEQQDAAPTPSDAATQPMVEPGDGRMIPANAPTDERETLIQKAMKASGGNLDYSAAARIVDSHKK